MYICDGVIDFFVEVLSLLTNVYGTRNKYTHTQTSHLQPGTCCLTNIYIHIYWQVLGLSPGGTKPWMETKNPNDIEPGTLIRLGPVYNSPVLTEVCGLCVCVLCIVYVLFLCAYVQIRCTLVLTEL